MLIYAALRKALYQKEENIPKNGMCFVYKQPKISKKGINDRRKNIGN
jgi:hypothetical protein